MGQKLVHQYFGLCPKVLLLLEHILRVHDKNHIFQQFWNSFCNDITIFCRYIKLLQILDYFPPNRIQISKLRKKTEGTLVHCAHKIKSTYCKKVLARMFNALNRTSATVSLSVLPNSFSFSMSSRVEKSTLVMQESSNADGRLSSILSSIMRCKVAKLVLLTSLSPPVENLEIPSNIQNQLLIHAEKKFSRAFSH